VIKDNIVIREIEQQDNAQIEAAIRDCFPEFGLPLVGTAYADKEFYIICDFRTLLTFRENSPMQRFNS